MSSSFLEENNEQIENLTKWMVENCDILPSLSRSYAEKFAKGGVASMKRLAKKIRKDSKFLTAIGVTQDDAEEIVSVMQSEGIIEVDMDTTTLGLEPIPCTNTSMEALFTTVQSGSVIDMSTTPGDTGDIPVSVQRAPRASVATTKRQSAIQLNCSGLVDKLKTAISTREDNSICKYLTPIITLLEGHGAGTANAAAKREYQKAFGKADLGAILFLCMHELLTSSEVVLKCLRVLCLLCRSTNGEAADGLCKDNISNFGNITRAGTNGLNLFSMANTAETMSPLFAQSTSKSPFSTSQETMKVILTFYIDTSNLAIIEECCDLLRDLALTDENRSRLGEAGLCDLLSKCLLRAINENATTCCWVCRAIGQLAVNHDKNRQSLVDAGACEFTVQTLQRYQSSPDLVAESCYAIRCVGKLYSARVRMSAASAPSTIFAALKTHVAVDAVVGEAFRALVAFSVSGENQFLMNLTSKNGAYLVMKAVKRAQKCDYVAKWGLNLIFLMSEIEPIRLKLLKDFDILEFLADMLQNGGSSDIPIWASRIVYNLSLVPGTAAKMKTAGLCEAIVTTLQRNALNPEVSSMGCYALGALAEDVNNLERLGGVGACEAVIGALRRHYTVADVVLHSSFAVHFLAQHPNNVTWMGTTGGCEAVIKAMEQHAVSSREIASMTCRAVGSLAFEDEGNIIRFRGCSTCRHLVHCLDTHWDFVEVADFGCRAVYSLALDKNMVTDLGVAGACEAVVKVLGNHKDVALVVAQACMAINALAVRQKSDKVHKSNFQKLIGRNAIELVIEVLTLYADNCDVQRAGCLALAALARSTVTRVRILKAGGVDLVIKASHTFRLNAPTFAACCSAVDHLSSENDIIGNLFTESYMVERIITAFNALEKSTLVCAEGIRALITMSSNNPDNTAKITTQTVVRQIIRLMRVHDKSEIVSRWGNTFLCAVAISDEIKAMIGKNRGCSVVVSSIKKHEEDEYVCEHGCKTIEALATYAANTTSHFNNLDTCQAVAGPFVHHAHNAKVMEHCCRALIEICSHSPNITKLGSVGVCAHLPTALKAHVKVPSVCQLACECIYILCGDIENQNIFEKNGTCEAVMEALRENLDNALVATYCCKALAGLGENHLNNCAQIASGDNCAVITNALFNHSFAVSVAEWGCCIMSIIAAIPRVQETLTSLGSCKAVVQCMARHKHNDRVVGHAACASRALAHTEANVPQLREAGVLQTSLAALDEHAHQVNVVEHCSWLLGTIQSLGLGPEADDEFYGHQRHQQLIESCLKVHAGKDGPASCVCIAIGCFAENSLATNLVACDAMVKLYNRLSETCDPVHSQRVLQAIGKVASSNKDNQARLLTNGAVELVKGALKDISAEGSDLDRCPHGALRAVAGMANGFAATQQKFCDSKDVCRNVVRFLVTKMDDVLVAQWGCAAIAALGNNHVGNSDQLSAACGTLTEVLQMYMKSSPKIVYECLRAMSSLAHGHLANRSRFGSAGACQVVAEAFSLYLQSQKMALQFARVVADLAGNHSQNQARLEAYGACECLVEVLDRYCLSDDVATSELPVPTAAGTFQNNSGSLKALCDLTPEQRKAAVDSCRWTCWAIANLVLLGQGNDMCLEGEEVDDDEKHGAMTFPGPHSPSHGQAQPLRRASTFVPGREGANHYNSSGFFSAAANRRLSTAASNNGHYSPDPSTVANNPNDALVKPAAQYSRRAKFENGDMDSKVVLLLRRFSEHAECVKWISRMINSFGKARSLRKKMVRCGVIGALESASVTLQESWALEKKSEESAVDGVMSQARILEKEVESWLSMAQTTVSIDGVTPLITTTLPMKFTPSSDAAREGLIDLDL